MSYRTEFAPFPVMPEAAALIALGYADNSWHNDACPSFVSPCKRVRVWIDHPTAEQRDNPEGGRYGVEVGDFNDHSDTYNESVNFPYAGDDWHAALEAALCAELEAFSAAHSLEFLSADDMLARIIDRADLSGQADWLRDYIERWDQFEEMRASTTVSVTPLRTALELAGMFITTLREEISADDMQGVLDGRLEADSLRDTNMTMDAAFERLHGRGTWLGSDVEEGRCTEAQADADLALWNAAVNLVNSFLGNN